MVYGLASAQELGRCDDAPVVALVAKDLIPPEWRAFVEKLGTTFWGLAIAVGGVYGGVLIADCSEIALPELA
jgi:hypothetical protein